MAELDGIYQHSTGDKKDFLDRIVPITLDNARFRTSADRTVIAKHWKREFEATTPDWDMAAADFSRQKSMRDWSNHDADILAHISDKLHPQDFDSLAQNDFAALKAILNTRPAR